MDNLTPAQLANIRERIDLDAARVAELRGDIFINGISIGDASWALDMADASIVHRRNNLASLEKSNG